MSGARDLSGLTKTPLRAIMIALKLESARVLRETHEMDVIELTGRINHEGKLEVDLPEGLPPGEVRVRIERAGVEPLTEEEVERLMRTEPTTGAAIVAEGLTGGWRDLGIEDGQAWVEEQRRKRTERSA